MNIVYETERLILRRFDMSDAEYFYELNKDPEVMKYTADRVFASVEESAELIRNYKEYDKTGFGRWTVVLKETKEVLGWCGLKYIESVQEVDLGYRLHRKYWNMGYATEASIACLKYGFEELGLEQIVAQVLEDNGASVRVLEKVGMKYWKTLDTEENPGLFYRIRKEDFINSEHL